MCPPPQENPAILYGLMPLNAHPPKLIPALNPPKHAAYFYYFSGQALDPGSNYNRVVESVYPKSIDMPERFDVSHTGLWQSGSITIVEGAVGGRV